MSARFKKISLACAMVLITACGSSGSSGTSTETGTTGTASASDLTSFSTIPDVDLAALDVATNSTSASVSSLMLNTSTEDAGAPVVGNNFSVAGCTTRAMVMQTIENSRALKNNQCIMKAVEANTAFTIPQGSFGYHEMTMLGGEPGDQAPPEEGAGSSANENTPNAPMVMRAKVGVVDDILQLFLCEKMENNTFKQNTHFTVGITPEGSFETKMTNEHQPFSNSEDAPDANQNVLIDNPPAGIFLRAVLDSGELEDITPDKPVVLEAKFKHGLGGGIVNVIIGRDEEELFTQVHGNHQRGAPDTGDGYWNNSSFGKYGEGGGCTGNRSRGRGPAQTVAEMLPPEVNLPMLEAIEAAGYELEDEVCRVKVNPQDMARAHFPADFMEFAPDNGWCEYEDVNFECYNFRDNAEGDFDAIVIPFDMMADHHDFVAPYNENLSDQAPPVPVIEFSEADGTLWDCTAPEGIAFQSIDFAGNEALGTAVRLCHEERGGQRASQMDSCFDQRNQKDAEYKASEEIGTGSGAPPVPAED